MCVIRSWAIWVVGAQKVVPGRGTVLLVRAAIGF